MNRNNQPRPLRLAVIAAAIAAAAGLAACDRNTTPEQTTTAESVRQGVDNAATEARNTVADAAITASVNAGLARDNELSSLAINVDTTDGHVVLRGNAPNALAVERAAKIAQATDGVRSVDNQLTVKVG